MDSGMKIRFMVLEFQFNQMVIFTKENGEIIKEMELELITGQMEINI